MIKKILVVTVIIFGVFVRLYRLGQIPNSYSPDELAQGYTAFSLLETGKDEWGKSWPISLRSFGDFKPPLQTYLMIVPIKLFGLNEFSVRLPNAILSSLGLVIFYFLVNKLFSFDIAFVGLILYSFSPWSLPMSRIALEANIHAFFVPLGLLLLDLGTVLSIGMSAILFGLAIFSYHSLKIFVPIVLASYFYIFRKRYFQRSYVKTLVVFFILLTSFFLINIFSTLGANTRVSDISIFSPTQGWSEIYKKRVEFIYNGLNQNISKLFVNKLVYLSSSFVKKFFSYLSFRFLMTDGAGETTYGMLPGFGVLGFIGTIGVISSIYFFYKSKDRQKTKWLMFFSIACFVALIPAALAKGEYSANRVSCAIPYIYIIAAFGLVNLIKSIKLNKTYLYILLFIESAYFLTTYFFLSNHLLADGMLYGRKQSIEYIKSTGATNIIMSTKLSEPQTYVSFYEKVDPKTTQQYTPQWMEYQSQSKSFVDQLYEYHLANYTFRPINFASDSLMRDTVLVGKPEEFPGIIPDKIIYLPSHLSDQPTIYIYVNKT